MTKFLNISTDTTLGGSSASDSTVSSQKAIKAYVDSQTGTAPAFANITGQPTDNTNLASALNAKYDASNPNGYTSNIGTVTSVNNVSPVNGNVTLSIPAAQVNSDWNAVSGVAQILNKPNLATVATSGSYNDLSNKPTIPTNISGNKVNGAPLSNTLSHFFGVSTSAATDIEKVVSIPSITELTTGVAIIVLPTTTSTVANATLKLNNFTAYPMRYQNSAITTSTDAYTWTANTPSVFVFDSDYWRFVCQGYRQVYSTMSVSEGTTGTATTGRVVRADYLSQIIRGTKLTGLSTSTTGAVAATDTVLVGMGKLQATKQDNLVSGTNIKTINNTSILGSGNIEVGGGSASADGVTINTNSSDELQAIGLINMNTANGTTNPVYDWVGTLQEYETQQVETLHPDWICYITDDVSGGTSVYTKSQVNNLLSTKADSTDVNNAITAMLEGLYPVGSIYIGTTQNCPLASVISGSTWTLVSSGRVLQGADENHAVGSTIEAGLPQHTHSGTTDSKGDHYHTASYNGAATSGNGWGGGSCAVSSWQSLTTSTTGAHTHTFTTGNASDCIYGNSSTVQPPAYVVNIWQRTA